MAQDEELQAEIRALSSNVAKLIMLLEWWMSAPTGEPKDGNRRELSDLSTSLTGPN